MQHNDYNSLNLNELPINDEFWQNLSLYQIYYSIFERLLIKKDGVPDDLSCHSQASAMLAAVSRRLENTSRGLFQSCVQDGAIGNFYIKLKAIVEFYACRYELAAKYAGLAGHFQYRYQDSPENQFYNKMAEIAYLKLGMQAEANQHKRRYSREHDHQLFARDYREESAQKVKQLQQELFGEHIQFTNEEYRKLIEKYELVLKANTPDKNVCQIAILANDVKHNDIELGRLTCPLPLEMHSEWMLNYHYYPNLQVKLLRESILNVCESSLNQLTLNQLMVLLNAGQLLVTYQVYESFGRGQHLMHDYFKRMPNAISAMITCKSEFIKLSNFNDYSDNFSGLLIMNVTGLERIRLLRILAPEYRKTVYCECLLDSMSINPMKIVNEIEALGYTFSEEDIYNFQFDAQIYEECMKVRDERQRQINDAASFNRK